MKYFTKTAATLPMDIGRVAAKLRKMYPGMSKRKAIKTSKAIKRSLRQVGLFSSGPERRMQVMGRELSGRSPQTRFWAEFFTNK